MDFKHHILPFTRNGDKSSTIIVDPHMFEISKLKSAGVFAINALFVHLSALGYQPLVRFWSTGLNDLFDPATAARATQIAGLWNNYILTNGSDPFAHIENYILLQVEVGNLLTKAINNWKNMAHTKYDRVLSWIIGAHQVSTHAFYSTEVDRAHCLGANHFLGEALYCSNAETIMNSMFQFHLDESARLTPEMRTVLKQNIVLIDEDSVNVISPQRLQHDLQALGVKDVQVLVHEGRDRKDVPELYARTKVSIDCNTPGMEFINFEATLYDVLTLVCNSRTVRNAFDFPVPSQYLLDPHHWSQLVGTVHRLLVNHSDHC